MTWRLSAIVALSLFATLASADTGLIPLAPEQGLAPEGTTLLRGATTLTLYQRADAEPLRLTIDARRIGSYDDAVTAEWPADAPQRSVSVPPGETGELLLEGLPLGPVEVRLNAGQNAASVTCNGPLALPAAEDGPDGAAHFILQVGRLHFFVPRGVARFTVSVRGQAVEENARLRVFAPDGSEVGSATSIGGGGAELRVDVPAAQTGAAWSLIAEKPEEGVFEDCFISLGREVPQFLSPTADGLLVPFVSGLRQTPRYIGADAQPTARFALTRPVAQGTLTARVEGLEPITVPASAGAIEVPITADTSAVEVSLDSPELPALTATTPVALVGTMLFVGGYQPLMAVEPAGDAAQPTGIRVTQGIGDPPQGLRLEATLRRSHPSHAPGSSAAEVVQTERVAPWDGSTVEWLPDVEPADGAYEWQVVLRDETGTLLDWSRSGFARWEGTHFADQTAPPSQSQPSLPQGQWVSFAPAAADAVPYRHRPSQEEIARRIRLIATPGEYESATLGVLALEETRGLRASISDLRSGSGAMVPADRWELRWARYWPQRTGWNSKVYTVIPEMLERVDQVDLAALEPAQAWLTVQVPEDAEPGRYLGTVTLTDARGDTRRHQITLEVLPFALIQPEEHHWGLYTDSGRWRTMPERQVRAEMRDFLAHGITSAMMYPLTHSQVSLNGGDLRINSAQFERYMRWALEEGLRGPTVMSMQSLRPTVAKLLPEADPTGEDFERLYKQVVQHFVDLGERQGWGELVWHAVDEPNGRNEESVRAAVEELGWLKDLGLSTFTTVNDPQVAQENLNPVLDARCYYVAFPGQSAEAQRQIAGDTAAGGDRLWLYGTGCYTGMDGSTMPNRFLAGYLLRKIEAEGIWCWTLQRAKGDIYNDLDAEGTAEAKEACTTYVSEDGREMVTTLQWEGHREGVDDFRYIYTLEQLAAGRGERGQAALARLDALLEQVPWGARPGSFSAADSDRIRGEIARMIGDLRQ